jgi:hypothetical protein
MNIKTNSYIDERSRDVPVSIELAAVVMQEVVTFSSMSKDQQIAFIRRLIEENHVPPLTREYSIEKREYLYFGERKQYDARYKWFNYYSKRYRYAAQFDISAVYQRHELGWGTI